MKMTFKPMLIVLALVVGWWLLPGGHAQPQPEAVVRTVPATTPNDNTDQQTIAAQATKIGILENEKLRLTEELKDANENTLRFIRENKQLRDYATRVQAASLMPVTNAVSPYPHFVHAEQGTGKLGGWIFWLSDTNFHFHLSETNCLVLKSAK